MLDMTVIYVDGDFGADDKETQEQETECEEDIENYDSDDNNGNDVWLVS